MNDAAGGAAGTANGRQSHRRPSLKIATGPLGGIKMSKFTRFGIVIALAAVAGAGSAAAVTLRASHQFPGGKGDVRDEMVQIIARDAKAAGVDLDVQVYPGASLFKPNEQWNALVNGQLDISSFPLDYASGKVREFGATLMPGLVR